MFKISPHEVDDVMEMTWRCDVCGDERGNNKISVRTVDISQSLGIAPFSALRNIKYCNDRESCITDAMNVDTANYF